MADNKAREVHRALGVLETVLMVKRDQLNREISLVRYTSDRLGRQIALAETVGSEFAPEVSSLLERAMESLTQIAGEMFLLESQGSEEKYTSEPPSMILSVRSQAPRVSRVVVGQQRKKLPERKPRGKAPRKIGIHPVALRILKAIFMGDQISTSFPKALAGAFGPDWENTPFSMITGPGRSEQVLLGVDIAKGDQSVVRRSLSQALKVLTSIHEGNSENISSQVTNLYQLIRAQSRWKTIEGALRKWQVQVPAK